MKLGEAAFALGISEITLRRKVKTGRISHEFRDGKYFVLLKKDPETGRYLDSTPTNYVHTMQVGNGLSGDLDLRILALRQELAAKDNTIRQLQRTVEDQITLISFFEQSLASVQQVQA
jgi:hypothetical protein